MICRLCLKDSTEVIQIFDVVGLELNVSIVLGKYFWFEPKNDDPISTSICNSCWIKVSDFHEFFLSVEEAHRLLTERFSIKRELKVNMQERLFSRSNTTDTNFPKTSKIEPSEEDTKTAQWLTTNEKVVNSSIVVAEHNDDEMEMQFSVLLSDDENVDGGEAVESEEERKISLNTEFDAIENELEADLQQKTLESDNDEISLDEQYFVEKILNQAQRLSDEKDDLFIKEEPLDTSELRRSMRHMSNKKIGIEESTFIRSNTRRTAMLQKIKTSENYDDSEIKTKRRGRPRKSIVEHKQHMTARKSMSATRIAIDRKSQENDEKIAGYMRLLCHICSEELPTFAKLRIHFAHEHQEAAYAICCNKKFYKRVLLVEHIDKHLDPECYKCTTCNKIFADKQCVRNHMLLKHQPDEVKTFECEHCPKKFAKPYLLEQHLIVHADRTHICSMCEKRFPSAPQLTSHIKITHSNTYGTMCHICAKLIRGRAAFERHQLEHAGVKLPKVQCQKCGSWHKDKYSLQKHIRRHNEDGTVHICNICKKVAPNRSALLAHCRYVHASERTYECSVCKKAFKKPLSLREHMTTHTGEVLYSCPYCPKTFNSNANMHSHRKKMHPREFEEQRKLRRGQNSNDLSQETTIMEDMPHTIVASITNEDAENVSIILTTS